MQHATLCDIFGDRLLGKDEDWSVDLDSGQSISSNVPAKHVENVDVTNLNIMSSYCLEVIYDVETAWEAQSSGRSKRMTT
jgi:hypothetical protein